MRIISEFHDYYDSVMRQGMDKDVLYIRDYKEIDIKPMFKLGYPTRNNRERYETHYHLLGYCGQIIRIAEITDNGKWTKEYQFNPPKPTREKKQWWWGKDKIDEFYEQDLSSALELFHTYQVPLFLISTIPNTYKTQRLTLNPNLSGLSFFKYKNAYKTYQDIYQYIAGVLNSPEKKMVEISDKDKVHKHGFDKWSFRKMPKDKK